MTFRYKCKKEVTLQNFTKSTCKWNGSIEDYIQHVKRKHKSSYFLIEGGHSLFQWRLPYIGDLLDIGIFEYSTAHFLYKIWYQDLTKNLNFSLQAMQESSGTEYYCDFLLVKNEKSRKISVFRQVINDLGSEELYTVVIGREILDQFIDPERHFRLRICMKKKHIIWNGLILYIWSAT